MLAGKSNRNYLKDVKTISWELQQSLMVIDINKRELKNVVKDEQTDRRWVRKLKENNLKARFQERFKKLVDVDVPNILDNFIKDILKTCDEVCGMKKGRRNCGDS